ncbi:MAG: hypothetical protein B7Z55_06090 [Planctomycetales bacterium 12-60-4]|nr:MAG: hypothetical protein B7Z55_06090 [Planctomycetales bacterium 12-60-4]
MRGNELLTIGDRQIVVKVLEIRGGRVRLGISAPAEVAIRRDEIEKETHTADFAVAR